jgi:hypothetical protein
MSSAGRPSDRPSRSSRSVTAKTVIGPDGQRLRLEDLPLVAYALDCGHLGRDYAVKQRDLVFCRDCSRQRRVVRIIAG